MSRAITHMELRCIANGIGAVRAITPGLKLSEEDLQAEVEVMLDIVRAVIRTMYDPTPEMCAKQVHGEDFAASGFILTWQAMINAASPREHA